MDISEQYEDLTKKLNANLPLRAFPIRELVQVFRENGHPITLKTKLTISSVHNTGDISGILCSIELVDGNVIGCALSHLIFSKSAELYPEIIDYQKKRAKRVKQLNTTRSN